MEKKVSVIVPVFNEEKTVQTILKLIIDTNLATEIVVVDDGSTDGTKAILEKTQTEFKFKLISLAKNQGKGSAVRTGIQASTGDIILIQDADLEYAEQDSAALRLFPVRREDLLAYDVLIFGDRFPFRYFADEYGLRYDAAFPGCSEDSEPSVKTVMSLIDQIRAEHAPVILYIEFSSRKTADTLAAGA